MSITELSIKRPSLIVVIFTVLAFLGYISYQSLNYELLPKFDSPVLSVTTVYPGASPTEVEQSVTKKIENVLANLENLDEMNSTSMEGVSSTVLMLKANANVDQALQDAQRKINAMVSLLPEDSETPSLGKFSLDDAPILRLGITGRLAPSELYALVKDDISPALSKIDGVAQVGMIGGEEREIKVNINGQQLELLGVSLVQVSQALQSANMDFPTGKIKSETSQSLIRLKGKYSSLEEIKNLIIATNPTTGSVIRLQEVATVFDGVKDIKTINRIDGTNSIGLSIQKQSDANAVAISESVKEVLVHLEKDYEAQGVTFAIAADSSEFTLEAANAVMIDLALAIFIVALCMLLFLHSFRNALIVMVAIPASLVSVFIAMYLMGFTLNLMTLLAISLVVGILVDDSIVVLENIYRHLELGEEQKAAALKGRNEIGFTAMGITLVDVVVFLPITMVGGLISNLLTQFSVVIVVATLMSLFVSFTLTPLLASRLAKVEYLDPNRLLGRVVGAFERFLDNVTTFYAQVLQWALGHKAVVLVLTFILLVASFALVPLGFIGAEFVSNGDNGEFIITLELPQDATLNQTNAATLRVEEYLFNKTEVVSVFSNIGTSGNQMGGASNTSNKADINVKLVDKKEREYASNIIAQLVKLDLERILPDVKVTSAAASITGGANAAPIQLSVTGNNLNTNLETAEKVMQKLSSIAGTSEVKLSVETGNPEVTVNIDRDKMNALGLSMDRVGLTMQTAFNGNTNAKYTDDGKDYDINLILDAFDRQEVADIAQLSFVNSRGENINLNQFADIGQSTSPAQLERKNRIPSVTVSSQLLGVASSTITQEMNDYLADADIPVSTSVSFEGTVKNMNEAFGNLAYALLASILFVYLIMVALYDSYIYPFVVLFSIPVAIVGALLILALTMEPLSIFSMLGMIMLIGLVAKNAILLVDFANQRKTEGRSSFEALLDSGTTRLRPILMTTLAMVFGMMPIALASGPGAEWKNGLAWVLIGGLSSSMLLTLIVVPVVYLMVDNAKAWIGRQRDRGEKMEVAVENL